MAFHETLTDLLISPGKAFSGLKEQPSFWLPGLIPVIGLTVLTWFYYKSVDFNWLIDSILTTDIRMSQMSEAQKAKAAANLTHSVMMTSSLITMLLGLPLLKVLESAYYYLAAKVMNRKLSFRQGLAISCWASLPSVLLVPLGFVAIMLQGNGQLTPDQIYLVSLNELIFKLEPSHPWMQMLSVITIFQPWMWWLSIVGVKQITGSSTKFAVIFALTPMIVVYVCWAMVVKFV